MIIFLPAGQYFCLISWLVACLCLYICLSPPHHPFPIPLSLFLSLSLSLSFFFFFLSFSFLSLCFPDCVSVCLSVSLSLSLSLSISLSFSLSLFLSMNLFFLLSNSSPHPLYKATSTRKLSTRSFSPYPLSTETADGRVLSPCVVVSAYPSLPICLQITVFIVSQSALLSVDPV